jgi:predicted metal-dependent HD superfamily phosphohydrolase
MEKTAPHWLSSLRDDMESISQEAAREHWPGPTVDSPPYYNYRLEHVRQVERDALRLLSVVGGDRDVVLAAVWIHDRFQPQYTGPDHAALGAEWARQHLEGMGFPQQKVERVSRAVGLHSSAPDAIPPEEWEARLLWDADNLGKLGALSVVTFLCAMAAFPHEVITHAGLVRSGCSRLDETRLMVDSFYFQPSRVWAEERLRAKRHFVEALAREVAYGSDVD